MTINTLSVSVARSGAALPHVVTPWANLSGAGVHSALPQNLGPAFASTDVVFVNPRPTAAMAQTAKKLVKTSDFNRGIMRGSDPMTSNS